MTATHAVLSNIQHRASDAEEVLIPPMTSPQYYDKRFDKSSHHRWVFELECTEYAYFNRQD